MNNPEDPKQEVNNAKEILEGKNNEELSIAMRQADKGSSSFMWEGRRLSSKLGLDTPPGSERLVYQKQDGTKVVVATGRIDSVQEYGVSKGGRIFTSTDEIVPAVEDFLRRQKKE